ncbi:hypothetical protein QTN93_00475 [Sphingomonas aerolata]|uniref:hypothetical protein n=1 Tax=Sphingomonas aerolata TaxID=185951 RepID=UPI0035A6BB19
MAMKGLDDLQRKMKELSKAISALDGDITSVGFDPSDPQSIELAIQKMEAAIDDRVGNYSGNEMVQGIVVDLKEKYRQEIIDRAAKGRAAGGQHHDGHDRVARHQ